jgi:hypothetical protein
MKIRNEHISKYIHPNGEHITTLCFGATILYISGMGEKCYQF